MCVENKGTVIGFFVGGHKNLVRINCQLYGAQVFMLVVSKKLARNLHKTLGAILARMDAEEEKEKKEMEARAEKCPNKDPECVVCKMFPKAVPGHKSWDEYEFGEPHPNCANLTSTGTGLWQRRPNKVLCTCRFCVDL